MKLVHTESFKIHASYLVMGNVYLVMCNEKVYAQC